MASPQMVDSGIETTLSLLSPERRSSIASECFVPQCIDRKAQLVNENTQLSEKVSSSSSIREYSVFFDQTSRKYFV